MFSKEKDGKPGPEPEPAPDPEPKDMSMVSFYSGGMPPVEPDLVDYYEKETSTESPLKLSRSASVRRQESISKQLINDLFHQIDVDDDLSLTRSELEVAIPRLGIQLSVEDILERFDADESGTLDEKEFGTMMAALLDPNASLGERQMTEYKNIFTKYDCNGDGTIAVTELKALFDELSEAEHAEWKKDQRLQKPPAKPTQKELQAILREVDSDQSGDLDFAEFLMVTPPHPRFPPAKATPPLLNSNERALTNVPSGSTSKKLTS